MKDTKFSCMKGLAITGVVAGHLGFDTLDVFVNYWHLPVFYFVSGYFFKEKALTNGVEFFFSRFKRLLIPFFLLCVAAILCHNLFFSVGIISADRFVASDYIDEFKRLMLTLSTREPMVGAIWFLPSLFFVSVFAWMSAKVVARFDSKNYVVGGIVCCLIGVTGVALDLPSPLCMWQNMAVTGLFFFGYAVSRYQLSKYIASPIALGVSVVIIVICLLIGVRAGCQADAINLISGWYPLVFVSGVVMIFSVSSLIKDSVVGKFIGIIGDYSFAIMAFHFFGFKMVTAVHRLFDYDVLLSSFPTSDVNLQYWWIAYIMVGIAFPILLAKAYSDFKYKIFNPIILNAASRNTPPHQTISRYSNLELLKRKILRRKDSYYMLGIIVVAYKNPELTADYILNQLPNLVNPYVVVVVNNASTMEECRDLALKVGGVVYESGDSPQDKSGNISFNSKAFILHSAENLGFAKGNNLGAEFLNRVIHCEHILFSNNDIIIQPQADLSPLTSILDKNPSVGVVGPAVVGLDGHHQSPHRKVVTAYRQIGWILWFYNESYG